MLQQTRVERVTRTLPRFLKRFPTLQSLAGAPRSDVLREWKGMGYNNRAVRLHMAVRDIVQKYGGNIPSDIGILDSLPGIGKYTAHAVACFGFGVPAPVVDVNVRRVISRISRRMSTTAGLLSEREAWNVALAMLPSDTCNWNQALMDLGALVCTARNPDCPACPVRNHCRSYGLHRAKRPARRSGAEPEPRFQGVPRRIWRGRVVEMLRSSEAPLTREELRRGLMPDGGSGAGRFLREVLHQLEKDGVISMGRLRGRTSICLAG